MGVRQSVMVSRLDWCEDIETQVNAPESSDAYQHWISGEKARFDQLSARPKPSSTLLCFLPVAGLWTWWKWGWQNHNQHKKPTIPSHAKVMHGNLTIVASLKALVAREPVSTIFINEDQSQSEIIEAEMCWRHQISLYLLSTWKICPLKTCWFLNPENASDNLPSCQLCSLCQLSRVSFTIVDTDHMSTYVPACITFTCTTTTTGIAS